MIVFAVRTQGNLVTVEVNQTADCVVLTTLQVIVVVLVKSLCRNGIGGKPLSQVTAGRNGCMGRRKRRELFQHGFCGIRVVLFLVSQRQDGQLVVDILLALGSYLTTVYNAIIDNRSFRIAHVNQVDAIATCSHHHGPRDGLRLTVGTGCNADGIGFDCCHLLIRHTIVERFIVITILGARGKEESTCACNGKYAHLTVRKEMILFHKILHFV